MSSVVRPSPAPSRLMTAEEFCEYVERPENAGRFFELDAGRVIELPPPQPPHGLVAPQISFFLETYRRRRGRGRVFSGDAGVIVSRDPDTVRGPDVMYYEQDITLADMQAAGGYAETPPALAVEILSPSDRPGRVSRKVAQYLNAGVKVVWLVDPQDRDVTVYRPGVEPQILAAAEELTGDPELPGFACRVAEFFE